MSKKRRRSPKIKAGPFSGLYSHRILETVVEALDLRDSVLSGRTARRFFRGAPVNEYNRKEIFGALGQALIDRGIAPELPESVDLVVSSARVYGDSMEFAARRWDNFMSRIQSRSSWDVDGRAAGRCFLSLAVVDLSVRVFALGRMANMEFRPPAAPLWAEQNGVGKVLRSRLADSGLTRDQLAAWMDVSTTSVDNWLDGRNHPDDRYVAPLVGTLARGDQVRARRAERELRREFTLAKLCEVLASAVGREAVVSAVETISSLVAALYESARPEGQPRTEMAALESMLLIMGSEHPAARPLLTGMAGRLPDERSRADVLAAAKPWDLAYVEMLMWEGGTGKDAAGLAQNLLDVLDPSSREQAVSVGESIQSKLSEEIFSFNSRIFDAGKPLHPLSFLDEILSTSRRLAARFPSSPEAHYILGSYLGKVAEITGRWQLVEDALLECRIASGLCPAWDAPAVERGIILANFGEHEIALRELQKAREELPEPTPHWRFAMGCELTMLERFREGMEHLEEVIDTRPDFGLTYSYAARCAFGMGDKARGRRYAKLGRQLGEQLEYDAWRAGEYGGRGNK